MKTHGSPHLLLCFLFLVPGLACSADDAGSDEGGASPDAGDQTSPPDAAEPPPPDAEPPAGFTLDGEVVGAEIPADAEVAVMWVVSATSPDHVYKYGDGSATGSRFVLSLADGPPPALAVNDYGGGRRMAVGYLVMVATGTDFPDGILDPEAELPLLGASRTPIIWREGSNWGEMGWLDAFEEATFECGGCVQAPEGETFDTFEPKDCGEVVIDAPPTDDDCNWT